MNGYELSCLVSGGLLFLFVVLPAVAYLCSYAAAAGRIRYEFHFLRRVTGGGLKREDWEGKERE